MEIERVLVGSDTSAKFTAHLSTNMLLEAKPRHATTPFAMVVNLLLSTWVRIALVCVAIHVTGKTCTQSYTKTEKHNKTHCKQHWFGF